MRDIPTITGTSVRAGFSLVELLVVCGVIIALLGIGFPIYGKVRRDAELSATRGLVRGIAASIASYQRRTWSWSEPGLTDPKTMPLWDLDQDGVLDGHPDPDGDGAVIAGFPQAAYDAGYTGFISMVQPQIGASSLDPQMRVVDTWGEPLYISRAVIGDGASAAEAKRQVLAFTGSGLRIWSSGPDRQPDTDDDISDDLEDSP